LLDIFYDAKFIASVKLNLVWMRGPHPPNPKPPLRATVQTLEMAYQINLATLSGGRLFFLSHFFGTGNKTGVPGGRQFIAKSL